MGMQLVLPHRWNNPLTMLADLLDKIHGLWDE